MFKIFVLLFYGSIMSVGVYGMSTTVIEVYHAHGLVDAAILSTLTILFFSYAIWAEYRNRLIDKENSD